MRRKGKLKFRLSSVNGCTRKVLKSFIGRGISLEERPRLKNPRLPRVLYKPRQMQASPTMGMDEIGDMRPGHIGFILPDELLRETTLGTDRSGNAALGKVTGFF